MSEPIRVELPDEASATSLTHELLGRFLPELVSDEGTWAVDISPTRDACDVLTAVEQWLARYAVDGVTVHLDGAVYTLNKDNATRAARRRPG